MAAYLTVEQVAAMLQMDERWVWDAVRTKGMPHYRPPGSRLLRFREDEVNAWMEEARNRPRLVEQRPRRRSPRRTA